MEDCELKIKEETTAVSRCINEEDPNEHDRCICCGENARYIVKFAKSY